MLITRPEFPGEPDFLSDARGPAIFLEEALGGLNINYGRGWFRPLLFFVKKGF